MKAKLQPVERKANQSWIRLTTPCFLELQRHPARTQTVYVSFAAWRWPLYLKLVLSLCWRGRLLRRGWEWMFTSEDSVPREGLLSEVAASLHRSGNQPHSSARRHWERRACCLEPVPPQPSWHTIRGMGQALRSKCLAGSENSLFGRRDATPWPSIVGGLGYKACGFPWPNGLSRASNRVPGNPCSTPRLGSTSAIFWGHARD